ncbi:hypothetical protein U5640_09740 [Streptomyces sp. SS7]|uniref:hypothetical protein n=1 Tax=Streptomyces sp. SS7 TaxID=3108485 RepID=UPI0030EBE02A
MTFLPESAIPYLGLLPFALGMKAVRRAWRHHDDGGGEQQTIAGGPKTLADVIFANGGDNIGVHVLVLRGPLLRHPPGHRKHSAGGVISSCRS